MFNAFSYIPEQYAYKRYRPLNNNEYEKIRYESGQHSLQRDGLINLSYLTTSRLPTDILELTDKHVWGYDIQRLSKSGTASNVKGLGTDPLMRRFDNTTYQMVGINYSTINPHYITDRTKSLSELLLSSDINIKNVLTETLPEEFIKFGYLNIPSSVTYSSNDNRFYYSNMLGVCGDFEGEKTTLVSQTPLINLPNPYPTKTIMTRNLDSITNDKNRLSSLVKSIVIPFPTPATYNEFVKAKTLGTFDLFSYNTEGFTIVNRQNSRLSTNSILPKAGLTIERAGLYNNIRSRTSPTLTYGDNSSPWYNINVEYDQNEELFANSKSQYLADKWVPY